MPMPVIQFAKPGKSVAGTLVVLAGEGAKLSKLAQDLAGPSIDKAIAAAEFKGKAGSSLDLLVPAETDLDRLVVSGIGKVADMKEGDWLKLGGTIGSKLANTKTAAVLAEVEGLEVTAANVADLASGILMLSVLI